MSRAWFSLKLHRKKKKKQKTGAAFILQHSESRIIFVDRELSEICAEALEILKKEGHPRPLVVDIDDPHGVSNGPPIGDIEFRQLVRLGSDNYEWNIKDGFLFCFPHPKTKKKKKEDCPRSTPKTNERDNWVGVGVLCCVVLCVGRQRDGFPTFYLL